MSISLVFDKPIEEVSLTDVQDLRTRQVAEGLFVEYKSDFQSPRKISHSITSFANTHGGWYFIGIKADTNNVPEDFSGFDLSRHRKPKEEIRDIIVGNISPIPLFYSKYLEVESNKGILVVYIPESYETPHITKDGRIYRRNAEGSDPVPETDRYTIDKLYERSKRFDETVERFCQREITISKAQEEQGWLEVYLLTYPLNKLRVKDFFEMKYVEEIRNFFNESIELFNVVSMGIPFNNISTSLNSLIMRPTTPESLPFLTLTFQYFHNGNAKIVIPFEYLDPFRISESVYASSESLEKLLSMLKQEDLPLYKIVDGWKFFNVYMVLSGKYIELLRKSGWKEFILARCRLVSTWRHILFFDSDLYTNHFETFGVPICLKDESDIPGLLTRNFLKEEVPKKNEGLISLFGLIMECLGFPPKTLPKMIEDWINYLKEARTLTSN